MGVVITFPQAPCDLREVPTRGAAVSASVVILPAVRIERTCDEPSGAEAATIKSASGRKRRRRATPP
jgi:hypothetical protein